MKKLLKIIVTFLLFILFIFVSGKLFFEEKTDQLVDRLQEIFRTAQDRDMLKIAFSRPLTSLDPASAEVAARERLSNIYEGLVATDGNLQIKPTLAVSYGSIDELTWEFRLRPNVLFHNGAKISVKDVQNSINHAQTSNLSQISNLLGGIDGFEQISEDVFRITTKEPDPLLLQKLALVPIYPESAEDSLATEPVGTGPYMFENLTSGTLSVTRFADYWGDLPEYTNIQMATLATKEERAEALRNSSFNIIVGVPPEIVQGFSSNKMKIVAHPSIEVNFLLFNFEGVFSDPVLREAATLAIDRREVARLGFGFAEPASQFAGSGVYGYDPSISVPKTDIKRAGELVRGKYDFDKPVANIDLPDGLETLGAYLQERLQLIGIDVRTVYHNPESLRAKITSDSGSDLFFMGWRSDLGDSSDILSAMAHSREEGYGQFNFINYENDEADGLIEDSEKMIDPALRLDKLRQTMKIVVKEDMIGIPLFSPQILYGVSEDISWQPRTDGYLFGFEVK